MAVTLAMRVAGYVTVYMAGKRLQLNAEQLETAMSKESYLIKIGKWTCVLFHLKRGPPSQVNMLWKVATVGGPSENSSVYSRD
jgi:hypothetical protein